MPRRDGDTGLSDTALAAYRTVRDLKRPVRVVLIGIGDEVDRGELKEIADTSGYGGVFIAEDPTTMSEIFLQAVATRTGA